MLNTKPCKSLVTSELARICVTNMGQTSIARFRSYELRICVIVIDCAYSWINLSPTKEIHNDTSKHFYRTQKWHAAPSLMRSCPRACYTILMATSVCKLSLSQQIARRPGNFVQHKLCFLVFKLRLFPFGYLGISRAASWMRSNFLGEFRITTLPPQSIWSWSHDQHFQVPMSDPKDCQREGNIVKAHLGGIKLLFWSSWSISVHSCETKTHKEKQPPLLPRTCFCLHEKADNGHLCANRLLIRWYWMN